MEVEDPLKSTRFKDSNNQSIDLDNFVLQNCVGRGSFSKVYRTKDKVSGENYAAKVLSNEITDKTDEEYINISREVNIMAKLNHPSILKFIGYSSIDFKKRPRPVIITEYSSNGTLDDFLTKKLRSNITNTQKLIILYGIASGMSYLHSNNILHRDLKPSNILLDDYLFPKIADFGLSKVNHSNLNSMTFKSVIRSVKGTPIYISPEIWENSLYSQWSDVYAFSIIVYQMMTSEIDFKKEFESKQYYQIALDVKNGYRPNLPFFLPQSYKNLIESCWSEKPSQRPTFDQIVYQLKNDRNFLAGNVDVDKFRNYVNYVDNYKATYDSNKIIDCLFNKFTNVKKSDMNMINEYFSMKSIICPFKKFIELNEYCRKIVLDVRDDQSKQFLIGKYFLEGQEMFPQIPSIGLKYLKKSMNSGSIESAIYYCKILIKGNIIPSNIKKAKKILEKRIKDNNTGEYYFLFGKISKKEKNYNDSLKFFKKSILLNNYESMYEYGQILFKDKFSMLDKQKGIHYYQKAIEYGCTRAMYKIGMMTIKGKELPQNQEQAEKILEMAAEKGHPKAIKEIKNFFINVSSKAISFLKKGSYLGDPEMMYLWAIRNEFGLDTPKNIKEAMNLMKLAADKGYTPAIVDYGIHLLNGINVPKNLNKAKLRFKSAAQQKDPWGQLWFYVMSKNDNSGTEDFSDFLNDSLHSNKVPEAWAVYGRELIEKEDSNALSSLYHACMFGSINAFLCIGQFAEINPSYGDSHYHFQRASNFCHCLDVIGYTTPIKYKVFHCDECNINMCEGCAKYCHFGHNTKEVNSEIGFKCECGKSGFKGKCSGEFVGETMCYQHLYQCKTCVTGMHDIYICKSCAEVCHKGHEIIDCGIQRSYCSCGMKKLPHNFKCSLLEFNTYDSCSFTEQKQKQRFFQCTQCCVYGNENLGICYWCSRICHETHSIIDCGVKDLCCCCESNSICFISGNM